MNVWLISEMRGHSTLRWLMAVVMALLLAVALNASAGSAPALALSSKYKGTYEYVVGDIDSWGYETPAKQPGYSLLVRITKVKGKKVTFVIQQSYFYGTTGGYISDSKPVTVKLNKKRMASFKFKSLNGSKGKGTIRLVSKNKVKLRLKTNPPYVERIPPGMGWKYKTLKRKKA